MEMLVVMAIIATLLTLATPKYLHSVQKGKEAVLKHDLHTLRDAIDKFLSDRGRYPEALDELAELHYLRKVPVDPVTDSAQSWVIVPPREGEGTGVYDVRSGAAGNSLDGDPYDSW